MALDFSVAWQFSCPEQLFFCYGPFYYSHNLSLYCKNCCHSGWQRLAGRLILDGECGAGLPDFSWNNTPKQGKITIKYTKWP
jgi:hypothetical protein